MHFSTDDIRYIFFDLDDTLLDHKAAEKISLTRCRNMVDGLSDIPVETLIQTYRSLNKALWEDYGAGHIDRATLQRSRFEGTLRDLGLNTSLSDDFGLAYMAEYGKHWTWVPGARQAWEKVRNQWPAGIITNGFAETQKAKFRKFGLDVAADALIISEEIGVMKPHPEIFAYASRHVGADPSQILYVGDSPQSDIHGAAHAGFRTAWFTRDGQQASADIPADFVFDDFAAFEQHLEL